MRKFLLFSVILMVGVIAVGLLMFTPKLAEATILEFEYVTEFSEGSEPEGDLDDAPWLTAIFNDGGTAGSVTLTLKGTNLTENEFVPEWYFNLDPALDPDADDLDIEQTGGNVDNSGISTGTDAFQADGDGLYDILIQFPFNGPPGGRFMEDATAFFEISGIASLTADDFNFFSTPAGGKGPFETAAKVQAIGAADESGWVTIPEPATMLLLGTGLIGLAGLGRKKFFRKS